jgi:hypothetical protein
LDLKIEIAAHELTLKLGNEIALPVVHGEGRGHAQIASIFGRFGGRFTPFVEPKQNVYLATLALPIRLLELSPIRLLELS